MELNLLRSANRVMSRVFITLIGFHSKRNDENFKNYCNNFTNDSWNLFREKLENCIDESKLNKGIYHFEEIDLKDKINEIVREKFSFCNHIDATSLKSYQIEFYSRPAVGITKLEYNEEFKGRESLYTLTSAKLSFSQTATGGLIAIVYPPQCKGLLENIPDYFIFSVKRRIEDVTESNILGAINFFIMCQSEKSLYGKSTLLGRMYFSWVQFKYKLSVNALTRKLGPTVALLDKIMAKV